MSTAEQFLTAQQPADPFQITDQGAADWALRKLRVSQKRMDELKAFAAAEITKIEQWLAKELETEQRSEEYFTRLLDQYHWPLYQEDPKRYKSLKLPNGTLRRVKQQPQYQREDDKLLLWLESNQLDDLIVRTAKPKWAAVKKAMVIHNNVLVHPDTGEVVCGVTVVPQEEIFHVEVN